MADTYIKKIVNAIAASLDTAAKPTGLVVSTSRQRPNKAARYIAVFPVHDEAAGENIPRNRVFMGARRLLTVAVVCRHAGTDLDNEVLRAWATAQLFQDVTLGGIAVSLNESDTDWHGELDSQNDYSQAVMQFVIEYCRPKSSLEYAE